MRSPQDQLQLTASRVVSQNRFLIPGHRVQRQEREETPFYSDQLTQRVRKVFQIVQSNNKLDNFQKSIVLLVKPHYEAKFSNLRSSVDFQQILIGESIASPPSQSERNKLQMTKRKDFATTRVMFLPQQLQFTERLLCKNKSEPCLAISKPPARREQQATASRKAKIIISRPLPTIRKEVDPNCDQWGKVLRKGKELGDRLVAEKGSQLDKVQAQAYFTVSLGDVRTTFSKNQNLKCQMASLTKIMTCLTVLHCCQQLAIKLDIMVKVTEEAALIQGTEARLTACDKLALLDLLYGLMLPSGNDAALALAQFTGKVLLANSRKPSVANKMVVQTARSRQSINCFLSKMNQLARRIGLAHSHFASPHGLNNEDNYSCAKDLAILCASALQHSVFRAIVGTKQRTASIFNQRTGLLRQETWTNSNRLLGQPGYFGVKTGKTSSAGPCFAGFCSLFGEESVTVVLNSQNRVKRFEDTHLLTCGWLRLRGLTYPKTLRFDRKCRAPQQAI